MRQGVGSAVGEEGSGQFGTREWTVGRGGERVVSGVGSSECDQELGAHSWEWVVGE